MKAAICCSVVRLKACFIQKSTFPCFHTLVWEQLYKSIGSRRISSMINIIVRPWFAQNNPKTLIYKWWDVSSGLFLAAPIKIMSAGSSSDQFLVTSSLLSFFLRRSTKQNGPETKEMPKSVCSKNCHQSSAGQPREWWWHGQNNIINPGLNNADQHVMFNERETINCEISNWPANYPPLFIPTFLIQPSNNNKVESLSLES